MFGQRLQKLFFLGGAIKIVNCASKKFGQKLCGLTNFSKHDTTVSHYSMLHKTKKNTSKQTSHVIIYLWAFDHRWLRYSLWIERFVIFIFHILVTDWLSNRKPRLYSLTLLPYHPGHCMAPSASAAQSVLPLISSSPCLQLRLWNLAARMVRRISLHYHRHLVYICDCET